MRQRHRQREKQAPCREPHAGLGPRTPGSHPALKADAQPLSHPGAPRESFKGPIPACFSRSLITKGPKMEGRKETEVWVFCFLFFVFLPLYQPASACRGKPTPALKTVISVFRSQEAVSPLPHSSTRTNPVPVSVAHSPGSRALRDCLAGRACLSLHALNCLVCGLG